MALAEICHTLNLRDRVISTKYDAFIMGIVNATKDSFWEKSRGGIERALQLIDEGADIIDIGAESTRPGAAYVKAEDEIKAIVPIIEAIRAKSDIAISIDTRKKSVMEAAFNAGADILNDVSALEDDEQMALFAAEKKIPVILMHKRGTPENMQKNASYSNAFNEVDEYLKSRVDFALSSGIAKDKIILDPGIGFGKDLSANLDLIAHASELLGGEYPVLMALSRKTCIGQVTSREVQDRMTGTITADLLSVLSGCSLVRVHDVGETVDSLKILHALKNSGWSVRGA